MAEGFRRLLFWIVLVPASLLLVFFALANRQRVSLSLLPFENVELPLFLIFFLSVLFGALLGSFITWNAQRAWRQLARRQEREIGELRDELKALKSGTAAPPARQDWQILPPF